MQQSRCEGMCGEKGAWRSPQRAKIRGVKNGIGTDSFSRRGREKLTPDNEGAVDKPTPRCGP